MTITYGDLDKLRDQPGHPGALSKLRTALEPTAILDKLRIVKFCRALGEALVEYEKLIEELCRRYGIPLPDRPGIYQLSPGNAPLFAAEKAKIDSAEVVDMPSFSPLPVSAYEKVPLTPGELDVLLKFIVLPDGI
jgi:hypothetical protein